MLKVIEVKCCGKEHPRVEGWACWRHLFSVEVSDGFVTISKTCPSCKVVNSVRIMGQVCPESVEPYIRVKERANGSQKSKRLDSR